MAEAILLGGLKLELRPLKLGQLRHVLDALDDMAGKSGGGLIESAARVIAAGLAPTHPEWTAEKLLDLEAGIEQLNDAVAAVLRNAGLHPRNDSAGAHMVGEARPVSSPGMDPASSLLPSTAPSPPAAATPTR